MHRPILSVIYTTKAEPAPISQKHKPTIIIFIDLKIVDSKHDMLVATSCNFSILQSWLTIHSY